ncbi:hypothetical protein F2P56_010566, partial [Juglans regia]
MKYLGLPLGASFKSERIWNDVVERVEHRLAAWKRLYLSKGGRLTLIKSTLSNLPTYFLSLFPLPTKVANRIEKLQRDFLWSGLGEEFKFYLVNWSTVCTPISEGGLGIRHLLKFNQALLGDSSRIRFWFDIWCGNHCLRDTFPTIFALARAKEASIAFLHSSANGTPQWNIDFIRAAHDWELESFTEFFVALYS